MLKAWHIFGQRQENLFWLFYTNDKRIFLFDFDAHRFYEVFTDTPTINLPLPKDGYQLRAVSRQELRREWTKVFQKADPPFSIGDIEGY